MSTEKLHPETLDTTEEGENKKENEDNSIREIVRHFTAETTFHGLKYIAEETRYLSRRLVFLPFVKYKMSDGHPSFVEFSIYWQHATV